MCHFLSSPPALILSPHFYCINLCCGIKPVQDAPITFPSISEDTAAQPKPTGKAQENADGFI